MNKSKSKVLKDLEGIPGVGKSIARDFWDLGLRSAEELKKQSPEALYERLCAMRGKRIDRCMLYVFCCAPYHTSKKKTEKENANGSFPQACLFTFARDVFFYTTF